MTNYRKTIWSYKFLDNTPENEEELIALGVVPADLWPGKGVLVNVELNTVVDNITADDFARDYEPIV